MLLPPLTQLAVVLQILEFYQMGSQSGQSSEMLGGCLNHPKHPSL